MSGGVAPFPIRCSHAFLFCFSSHVRLPAYIPQHAAASLSRHCLGRLLSAPTAWKGKCRGVLRPVYTVLDEVKRDADAYSGPVSSKCDNCEGEANPAGAIHCVLAKRFGAASASNRIT